jgi:integrase/recombinase XerC
MFDIGYPKKEKKLPKFVYYDELENIFEEAKKGKFGIRNSLIIELLYDTGVRVSELSNIKIKDIDYSNNSILLFVKIALSLLV